MSPKRIKKDKEEMGENKEGEGKTINRTIVCHIIHGHNNT